MQPHAVVSSTEWLAARRALLAREKELTRLEDEISAARRALPWTVVAATNGYSAPRCRWI